jgi:hypothetical protein
MFKPHRLLSYTSFIALVTICTSGLMFAQKDEALTNADVVAMSKADLGDDIITGKILQAPAEKLDVSTDSLIALKKAGISKGVMAAMLKRVDQRNGTRSAAGVPAAAGGTAQNPNRPVSVKVNGTTVVIEPVAGVQRFVNAYFVMKSFLDFPGTAAVTKVSERRVSVLIQSDLNPSAQFWLVKPKVLEDKELRTVKIGSIKGAIAPDEDWTVPVTIEKASEGVWAMTSKKDLKPGEYGVFKMGPYNTAGSDLLFGFTVN